ncbi:hypothetical protein [Pseudemcibacter aquimaris]|uniref:hypothetical protein n=1 Tax=Pseudemcibacter aquimaris TaxID=2857064 RepID=UPI0020121BCB|nr:hypothetical protein [Pseudemcibacter aquimaris]MCC3859858.1 hypothetical protein [Pseudemcibacter aquimaris]WDU57190.1 hypothetical protein KW060_08265 [Pseudemcibacter aquimaris]
MKISRFIAILSLMSAVCFSYTQSVFAQNKTYNRMINGAAKVVRAKFTGSEEVRYNYDEDNQNIVCGYIMDVEVIKSYKGGTDNFKVFVSNEDILLGEDLEYFIIARRNQKFGETRAIDFLNCLEGRSTRTDVSKLPYLATNITQQIFPLVSYKREDNIVDPDTRVVKKGEWMMLVNRIANNALPYTIARRRLNNGNDDIIEEMRLNDFIRDFELE